MGESARAPSREVGTLKLTAVNAFCLEIVTGCDHFADIVVNCLDEVAVVGLKPHKQGRIVAANHDYQTAFDPAIVKESFCLRRSGNKRYGE